MTLLLVSGGVLLTLLLAVSSAWQSWQRNESLAQITHPALYFGAIWVSFALWIPLAMLVVWLARRRPLQPSDGYGNWFWHLGAGLALGSLHLLADTLLLWASLGGAFHLGQGLLEKLIRWLPYELLAYWVCLLAATLARPAGNAAESPRYVDRIGLRENDQTRLVPVAEVDLLEACDNYVKVWQGEQRQLIRGSLARLEKQLDPARFVRIHRSFIVNLDAIDHVARGDDAAVFVHLAAGRKLPVSRRRRAQLNRRLECRA